MSSSDILDSLNELFSATISSQNKTEENVEVISMNKELESAFSYSNETPTNNDEMTTKEKIMALFNTPQMSTAATSGINIRPLQMQPSNRMYFKRKILFV